MAEMGGRGVEIFFRALRGSNSDVIHVGDDVVQAAVPAFSGRIVILDYDDEQQFYPRSAIQPSAALENSSRQMVQKREALVVIGAAPEPQPPKWVGGKSEEGVFCEGTLGQRQAAKK
ncbi:hypothetical protein B0H14DRAFT_2596829 [Mycena olivaceomarginata]|nr:hypothetical protein B0H14DRAFT_2596829 [Mycena olivaceomarginata]